ncbi:MAG: hypothetical protein ACI90V_010812, partial [Bacillariaceae sp.]
HSILDTILDTNIFTTTIFSITIIDKNNSNSMAPEIGLGQRYNFKADVYSFAILLYEVLTLEKVFQGWKLSEISDRVYLKKYRPRLFLFWSQQLKEVLKSCWSDLSAARLSMKHVETILHKEANDLTIVTNTDIDE